MQTLEQGPLLMNSSKNERGFAVDLRITDNRSVADNQKAGVVFSLIGQVSFYNFTPIDFSSVRTRNGSLGEVIVIPYFSGGHRRIKIGFYMRAGECTLKFTALCIRLRVGENQSDI